MRRRRPAPDAGGRVARAAAWRSPTRSAWCRPARSSWRPCAGPAPSWCRSIRSTRPPSRPSPAPIPTAIERIVLTASGGPFRTWSLGAAGARHAAAGAAPSQLVDGPQDHHQFGHPDEQGAGADRGLSPVSRRADQLEVVVHPQSIIHALVGYRDGSMLAQLSSQICAPRLRSSLAWPQPHGGADQAPRPGRIGAAELRAPRRAALPGARPGAPGHAARRHGARRAQCGQRDCRGGLPGGTPGVPSNRPTCGGDAGRRQRRAGCWARARTWMPCSPPMPRPDGWR